MQKKNYSEASLNFEQSESIDNVLRTPKSAELSNLQKRLIYRSKNKVDKAFYSFKIILVKPANPAFTNIKVKAYYHKGKIMANQNRYNLTFNYLNKAFELNSKTKNLDQK